MYARARFVDVPPLANPIQDAANMERRSVGGHVNPGEEAVGV
jgi:hypothetical protein